MREAYGHWWCPIINPWEGIAILQACFIQIIKINAPSSLFSGFLYKDNIGQPLRVDDLFNKSRVSKLVHLRNSF